MNRSPSILSESDREYVATLLEERPDTDDGPKNKAERLALAGSIASSLRQARSSALRRRITTTDPEGKPVRVITGEDYLRAQAKRLDIEHAPAPGKRPTHVRCAGAYDGEICLTIVRVPGRGGIARWRPTCPACKERRFTCQTQGCGRGLAKTCWNSAKVLRRGGRPATCRVCSNRLANAARSPEQRSASARKGAATRTPEQRRASATRGTTPEERSAVLRMRWAGLSAEQRSAVGRKANAARSPEQRSASARKAWHVRKPEEREQQMAELRKQHDAIPPERWSAALRKAWATRRARAAAKESGE